MSTQAPTKHTPMRTFLVSGLGTALEYYDFLIYGFAAAIVFPTVFFPSEDPLVGTLFAFAAFGTGFLARPLGGIVFGHYGDRVGRRRVLMTTLLVMGVATFGIGLLPSHASIGVAAPILLVVLRLLQGFAAGGEWGGAALFGVENAPDNRRGLWGSFTSMGIGIGGLVGTLVFTVVSQVAGNDALLEWAWRIPFLIGGLLLFVSMAARGVILSGHEEVVETTERPPVVAALRERPLRVLLTFGISYGYSTVAYIGSTFFMAYVVQIGFESTQSLLMQLASATVIMCIVPFFGLLSDYVGRRPVLITGAVLMAAYLFAYFPLVGTGSFAVAIAAWAMTGLLLAVMQGTIPAFLSEQYPRRMRYSGTSLSYQLGAAIGGGTSATIAAALLIALDRDPVGVALYGTFAMAVVVGCTLALRETRTLTLEEIDAE